MFATRAGWLEECEVTEVWFDPQTLPFAELLEHGIQNRIAREVWTTTAEQHATAKQKLDGRAHPLAAEPRGDKDPKYYLGRTPWRHVPMTPAQASRCNAVLVPHRDGDPAQWLSPRQRAWHAAVTADEERAWPVAIDVSLPAAWAAAKAAKARK